MMPAGVDCRGTNLCAPSVWVTASNGLALSSVRHLSGGDAPKSGGPQRCGRPRASGRADVKTSYRSPLSTGCCSGDSCLAFLSIVRFSRCRPHQIRCGGVSDLGSVEMAQHFSHFSFVRDRSSLSAHLPLPGGTVRYFPAHILTESAAVDQNPNAPLAVRTNPGAADPRSSAMKSMSIRRVGASCAVLACAPGHPGVGRRKGVLSSSSFSGLPLGDNTSLPCRSAQYPVERCSFGLRPMVTTTSAIREVRTEVARMAIWKALA